MKSAVLCFSGGLDSTVLLWELKNKPDMKVRCLSVNYGQRHSKELIAATEIAKLADVEHKIIDLQSVRELMPGSSQTDYSVDVPEGHYAQENMKLTVVPNRNMLLLALAGAWATATGSDYIAYAAHAGDHCLPATTPISTKRGLVTIEDIRASDEVMSFDPETKTLCWRRVIQITEKGRPEEILKITTRSGAVLQCTDEHQVYVVERHSFTKKLGWQKELAKKRAKDLRLGDCLVTPGGELDNQDARKGGDSLDLLMFMLRKGGTTLQYDSDKIWFKKGNKVNRFVKKEDVIKLVAWYITEGCGKAIRSRGLKANQYGVRIAQSSTHNPECLQEIMSLAREWGFHPAIEGEETNTVVSFSGPTTLLLTQCGRGSRNKVIPTWIMNSSNELLSVFFTRMLLGDGCVHNAGEPTERFEYITISKVLVRQMAYIGCRLGYKASVNKQLGTECYHISFYRSETRPNQNRYGESAFSPITKIEKVRNLVPVYDIGVEGTHNFFAGDTIPVLVSNSIYWDCRPNFMDAIAQAMVLAEPKPIFLLSPFAKFNKTWIAMRGFDLKAPMHLTWTCYAGREKHCGRCGSCCERAISFYDAKVEDPTEYEDSSYFKRFMGE